MIFALANLASATSEDCSQVISLAYILGMSIVQPNIMNQLLSNCCLASQVTCSDSRVVDINWSSMGLYTISDDSNPLPSINTPFPAMLLNLDLSNNFIASSFPVLLPNPLEALNLSNNAFYGTISFLPDNLKTLDIAYNDFAGELPSFATIKNIYLGVNRHDQLNRKSNFFAGTIEVDKPVNLYIYNTGISKVRVKNMSALVGCDLSKNPLNYSDIMYLKMCAMTDLEFTKNVNPPTSEKSAALIHVLFIFVLLFLVLSVVAILWKRKKISANNAFKKLNEF